MKDDSHVTIVQSTAEDIPRVKSFMFTFGPTDYNIVVSDPIQREFDEIATGETICFSAFLNGALVGIATCNMYRKFPQYESSDRLTGYLSQNVVHPSFRGQGIGQQLVEKRKKFLLELGVRAIYVTHHADNSGSGRALQKSGFIEVETFFDPEKRFAGSRKTTVRKFEQ